MSDWGLADMPDQSGRIVIVTGANSGLGYAATEAFVRRGAEVVMACRSLERGREAAEEIHPGEHDGSLTVMELNLAALDSVRRFTETFEAEFDALHVLCNLPRRSLRSGWYSRHRRRLAGRAGMSLAFLGVSSACGRSSPQV